MKIQSLVIALGLCSAALLSGCATSGTHAATEPLSANLSNYHKINVVLVSKVPAQPSELQTIQEQVQAKLAPRFSVVAVGENEKPTDVLQMKLELTDLQVIGGAAHFFLGPLAGPDRVAVNGTLTDLGTGNKLGAFTSTGEARLGGIVVGNTGTFRASGQLGEEIAELIKGNTSN